MSDDAIEVIPHGGEIHFADPDRSAYIADRIKILPGGSIWAVNKQGYELRVFSQSVVSEVATYTKHLEDEDWW
jgi:hypothetical protein